MSPMLCTLAFVLATPFLLAVLFEIARMIFAPDLDVDALREHRR